MKKYEQMPKFWGLSSANICKSCRFRQELSRLDPNSNEYWLADLQKKVSIQPRTSRSKFGGGSIHLFIRFLRILSRGLQQFGFPQLWSSSDSLQLSLSLSLKHAGSISLIGFWHHFAQHVKTHCANVSHGFIFWILIWTFRRFLHSSPRGWRHQ